MMLSLVIPVYMNEGNIPSLLAAIADIKEHAGDDFEAIFVVDGSPDGSLEELRRRLPSAGFNTQLLALSRNFGAFAAIRAGLETAKGDYMVVMAADLQEPPELVLRMSAALRTDECDVALGERISRDDPWSSRVASAAFWGLYRRLVIRDIPSGGVDIFGCNRFVRDNLVALRECNSSLVGLLFWVGFRRTGFPYRRARREIGKSAWTFAKKWRYMQDSLFSFSDLPITWLLRVGAIGMTISAAVAVVVLISALLGRLTVPGYAATMIAIIFFGTLNLLSTGILGLYVWRVFENTKGRPLHIVMSAETFERHPAREAAE